MRVLIITFLLVFSALAQAGIVTTPSSIVVKNSGKCLDVIGASLADGALVNLRNCSGLENQQWTLKPVQDAFQIIVKRSGKCLHVPGASLIDEVQLIQQACTGVDNELWFAIPKGDYFQLMAKHSGKCLFVSGHASDDGTRIIQSGCTGKDNGVWNIGSLSHTAILARHSNQCLNVAGNATNNGARITQARCINGSDNQQWTLIPFKDAYRLIVKHTGMCLNVSGESSANGTQVIQSPCQGTNNELWYPRPNGKYYYLIAKHSNKCLDVFGASQTTDANVVQYTCNGGNNQQWKIDVNSTTGGQWSNPLALTLNPVAAAGLPDGNVLLWSSHDRFSFGGGGKTYSLIFNPFTNQATERLVSETGHDMFCPGTSNLPDGRILVNGGVNSELTSIYNPANQTWTMAGVMNIPRGYQSNTVLSNGDVFTLGGSWSGGLGMKDGEVWNPASGWRRTSNISATTMQTLDPSGVYRSDNHAWFFGTANQQVFHAGPSKQMNWYDTKGAGNATSAGLRGDDADSMNGNAVMYDAGKILKMGGAIAYKDSVATNKAFVIDINNGVIVRKVAPLAYQRAMHSSVVLPNGQVLVLGGQAFSATFYDTQPILTAEIWDPATEVFTSLASMRIPRTYHSFAILLPDARVFVGGGGLCGSCQSNHPDAEIFTPPYLLNPDGSAAARPKITDAPAIASYGATIRVITDSTISSFALVRLSSITHTVNNDQRRIPVGFSRYGFFNNYAVRIPSSSGVVIPGYYMLFAMNGSGVPSIARMLKIS